MKKFAIIGVVAVVLVSLASAPAIASGGGACYQPISRRAATTVRIKNFCYQATVVHVGVGDTVTWTNLDDAPHTVTGANNIFGGYRKLHLDDRASYLFRRPGVFPYMCVVHPGMMGAVVVGGAGDGFTSGRSGVGSVKRIKSEPVVSSAPIAKEPEEANGMPPLAPIGLATVFAIVVVRLLRKP